MFLEHFNESPFSTGLGKNSQVKLQNLDFFSRMTFINVFPEHFVCNLHLLMQLQIAKSVKNQEVFAIVSSKLRGTTGVQPKTFSYKDVKIDPD